MTNSSPTSAAQRRYSSVAIVLHWVLALTLAFQLALGFAMPKDESGFAAYQLHKSVGIAILLLTVARLAWRVLRRPPPPLEGGLEGLLAKAVHAGFYAVLILGPLTGWLMVSSAPVRVPTVLFGLVGWPHLPVPGTAYDATETAHALLAWVAIGLFLLHVAGAVRHHLLLRDRLLERMAPAGSAGLAWTLALAVVATGVATLVLTGRAPTGGAEEVLAIAQPAVEPSAAASPAGDADAAEADAVPDVAEEREEAGPPAAEAPPAWTISPGGRLGFTVSNGGETMRGSFARWSGDIVFDPERPETARIAITVDLASASAGDAAADGMLKGAEFFAVAANPRAVWRATAVRRTGAGRYAADGTLSLKGVSRPQPLTFSLTGDGPRRSVRGSATIDRTAFGVGSGAAAENLAPRVSLEFAFDAVAD